MRVVSVNCVSYSHENEVFREIYKQLVETKKMIAVSQLHSEIESLFARSKSSM